MKVALFTPFSPDGGGGAALIKSILPQLQGIDITWHYLATNEAYSHSGVWLGPPFSPKTLLSDLSSRVGIGIGSSHTAKELIDKMQADTHWILAHNEGVSVAAELIASGKRVHLTVHDDPVGIFQRSRKYRAFRPLMSLAFARALRAATTVDVISPAMRDIYKLRYGIESFSQFRYVAALANVDPRLKPETIRVGHIGTLYHPEAFGRFLEACRRHAKTENKELKILRIGSSPQIDRMALKNRDIFEHCGELQEAEAIEKLSTCDFAYAMYPFGRHFRLFRQSSFPAKVATYVQAQRPIFAHTPSDSTLAGAITTYGVGEVCSSKKPIEIMRSISQLMRRQTNRAHFESFRADLLGSSQIHKMRAALCGQQRHT